MGAAAVPIMIGLTAATTVYSISEQRKAAADQKGELELQQRQENLAAADREIQRKRRLNAILGSQAAAAAAGGVMNSGSIANISISDAKQARTDTLVDRVNTATRINALRRQSSSISGEANARTAGTIMGAANTGYQLAYG